MTFSTQQQQLPLSIPVDQEHGGLRLVIAIFFLVVLVISFISISAFVPAQGLNLAAGLGGLLLAAAATYILEQQLKRRWQSGRVVRLDADGVALMRKQAASIQLPVTPEVQRLRWHFVINRRTRVPKGWHMVALALAEEDTYLTVFTLVSPEDYKALDPDGAFIRLKKQDDNEKSLRLAGEQRRLHKAESMRWHEGVEMSLDDFKTYNEHIERLYPA